MLRGRNGKPFDDPVRRGERSGLFRPLFITAGILLSGVLLLLMTSLELLVLFGYLPYAIRSLFTGAKIGQAILEDWTQWATIHQLFCLIGGFLWLAATVIYARRSGDACLVCARRDGPEGWQAPDQAARWGRIAVWVAMVVPLFYAFTRYAWALGFPLGMSYAYLRQGQERGMWTSGLFLATFGLVGGVLMLGLVQRWGEVFPHWMIGLSGRRVPIALAVVPAALVSVLLIVGGIGIWSALGQMVATLEAGGAEGIRLFGEIFFQVGATLLFPVWGVALSVATLGYYYRRRGPCSVCGRGGLTPGIGRKIYLSGLVLVLILSGCGPALPIMASDTGTPLPISNPTYTSAPLVEPLVLSTPSDSPRTPTVEVQDPPTPTETTLPTTPSTDRPKPIFKSSLGELAIETIRWVNEVNGVMPGPDEKLLLISISKPGQPKIGPSNFSLQAFDKAMREQTNGEVHIAGDDGTYAVCSMAGWVGSQHEMFAMGFRIPKTAKKLQLFWPGNEPIDLYPEE